MKKISVAIAVGAMAAIAGSVSLLPKAHAESPVERGAYSGGRCGMQ